MPARRRILVTEGVTETTKGREILISSTSIKTTPASSTLSTEKSTVSETSKTTKKTSTTSTINLWPISKTFEILYITHINLLINFLSDYRKA